jgi:hypothetical protein
VAVGLLAKAVDQRAYSLTDTPYSRASPLPQGERRDPRLRCKARLFQPRRQTPGFTAIKNVGAGLLAKAVDQPASSLTDTPYSRASPLPQGERRCPRLRCKARLFQPRRQTPGFTAIKNVGAGLLAKALDQPEYSLTDTPYSRASPLPHSVCISRLNRVVSPARMLAKRTRSQLESTIKNVGAGLPAKAACQSLKCRLTHLFRGQIRTLAAQAIWAFDATSANVAGSSASACSSSTWRG